ncbi:5630_t:CDS:1, partial [Racocetra fulgida]
SYNVSKFSNNLDYSNTGLNYTNLQDDNYNSQQLNNDNSESWSNHYNHICSNNQRSKQNTDLELGQEFDDLTYDSNDQQSEQNTDSELGQEFDDWTYDNSEDTSMYSENRFNTDIDC